MPPEIKTTRIERKFQEASKTRRQGPWIAVFLVVLGLGLWVGLVEHDDRMTDEVKIYLLTFFLAGQTILAVVRNQMAASLVRKLDEALGPTSTPESK